MKYAIVAMFMVIFVVGCGDEIYNENYNVNNCTCQTAGGHCGEADVVAPDDILIPVEDIRICGPWGCDIHYMDVVPEVAMDVVEVSPTDSAIEVTDATEPEFFMDTWTDDRIDFDGAEEVVTDTMEVADDVSVVDTVTPEDVIATDITMTDITDPPTICEHSWQCFDDDTCSINFCLWGKCREHPVCFWGFYCAPVDGFPACLRECTADDDCPTDKWCNSGRCEVIPECTANADCAPDEWCDAGKCRVNPSLTQCVITCPSDHPTAVVWYGADSERCVASGETFVVDFADGYCSWAIDAPTFKFNCTTNTTCADATTGWGQGNLATIACGVAANNALDPEQGNFGKRVVTMPGIKCSDLDL